MADAFIGEIRIFPFNFAPEGWLLCNGATLSISQYQVLFAVIGTVYGGDGTRTFMLPNILGNIPMHPGTGPGLTPRTLGEQLGGSQVGLNLTQLPSHRHQLTSYISADPATAQPSNTLYMSRVSSGFAWSDQSPNTNMSPTMFTATGGTDPHENRQPYLAMNFCICCTEGTFPPHPS